MKGRSPDSRRTESRVTSTFCGRWSTRRTVRSSIVADWFSVPPSRNLRADSPGTGGGTLPRAAASAPDRGWGAGGGGTGRGKQSDVVSPGRGRVACSGVVRHFVEVIRKRGKDGVPVAEFLASQGILHGIKVDEGTIALPNFVGEKFTQGIDGLRERLSEYRELGARFTKWRAVIAIGEGLPTLACLATNAQALALFAALSQEAGLVPIVVPEVLMDRNHTIALC